MSVSARHCVVSLSVPLNSMSKMTVRYNYPQVTPGSASNTKPFNSCNNKLRGDGILEMLPFLKEAR